MSDEHVRGVVFPADEQGRRGTTGLGRSVLAAALEVADPAAAERARGERDWRKHYLPHVRALVERGREDRPTAVGMARAGLDTLGSAMRFVHPDGRETGLDELSTSGTPLSTETVRGAEAATGLSIPYRGRRLSGESLLRQLDTWTGTGSMEPSAAEAVRTVVQHPEWLALPGRTVVVLGAGSEMGPLQSLLGWGATVAGIDLPSAEIADRVTGLAKGSAGTLLLPRDEDGPAGADLLHDLPRVTQWISALPGPLVLGNYVYADGATNLRLAAAADALTRQVTAERTDTSLAFLATPTDVFAVPRGAVEQSRQRFAAAGRVSRLSRSLLATGSGGRLLQPGYPDGPVCDSLVPQQGPNYALSKRVHRWRATVDRDAGRTVSMNVAPPTRTRSVLKNRALAAAYAGAHRFQVEIFDPSTSNTLMTVLLVHDLHTDGRRDLPWQEEADEAVHGGLWRSPYAPRSALGLAAVMGLTGARN